MSKEKFKRVIAYLGFIIKNVIKGAIIGYVITTLILKGLIYIIEKKNKVNND